MDIQAFQAVMDSWSDMARLTRANYHLTLGELITILNDLPDEAEVRFANGAFVGEEDSYRGYYSDLAFSASKEPSTVADVKAKCTRAATQAYEGYKGGCYTYDEKTPLWCASYGCCGEAIVSAKVDGDLTLITKAVE